MQWGKDWRQYSSIGNSWRYCRLRLRHPLLFWSCSGTWWWRRSERRSAAWKLPCSDSGTKNYPPLPGNRLKISRELIISTKYPNLHLCISWWRVNILHCVLLHPPITRGGAELNYYSWAGVTVPIPDRAEFQICHLPQVLILQRWGHRHVTFTNTAVDKETDQPGYKVAFQH